MSDTEGTAAIREDDTARTEAFFLATADFLEALLKAGRAYEAGVRSQHQEGRSDDR